MTLHLGQDLLHRQLRLPEGMSAMLVDQPGQGRSAGESPVSLHQSAVDAPPGFLGASGIGLISTCGQRPIRSRWALAQARSASRSAGVGRKRLCMIPPLGLRSVLCAFGSLGGSAGATFSWKDNVEEVPQYLPNLTLWGRTRDPEGVHLGKIG